MHYHIVVQDEHGEQVEDAIFGSLADAEHAVPLLIQRLDARVWTPNRYPGRAANRDEVAVYLDREHPEERRALSIVRCPTGRPAVDPECRFWGRHVL